MHAPPSTNKTTGTKSKRDRLFLSWILSLLSSPTNDFQFQFAKSCNFSESDCQPIIVTSSLGLKRMLRKSFKFRGYAITIYIYIYIRSIEIFVRERLSREKKISFYRVVARYATEVDALIQDKKLGGVELFRLIISVFQINIGSINIFPTPVSLSLSLSPDIIYMDVNK